MSQRIMVMMDCLLDTRMGTLKEVSPSWPTRILKHKKGWYWDRMVDNFDVVLGSMATAAFQSKYKERDIHTLASSFETNIMAELTAILAGTDTLLDVDPEADDNTLIINFWPYVFPDDAQADHFLGLIKARITPPDKDGNLAFDFNIKRVFIPMADLDTPRITQECEVLIMYHFKDWHDIHGPTIDHKRAAPRNVIIAASLFVDKEPDRDLFRTPTGGTLDPWDHVTRLYSPYIRILWWPVSTFSILKVTK